MCAPVAIFMERRDRGGRAGRLHQFKLCQSEIVVVLAETTPGRPSLGLEKTGQPIRAAGLSFLVFTPSFSCFMKGEMRNLSFFINTFTK